MNFRLIFTKPYLAPILIILIGYGLVALYLGVFLHYDFLRSDVLSYWQDSLAWKTPFHPFHVPGYPLTIAFLRGITFGIPSAIGLMMSINLFTFLASAFLIYRIINISGAGNELAMLGILLFGLWPFVGLTYTVDPLADMPAMFLFLTGLYFFLTSRKLPAALFFGFSLVTHKAMWLFVGLLIITEIFFRRKYILKSYISFVAVTLLPIAVLWLFGSFFHNSITWLFSSNLEVEVASKSAFPVLDGLLGTIKEGGIKGWGKGILLSGFACIPLAAVYGSIKLKYENYQYGLAISLTSLFLFLLLNQGEIWAAMRFGRLLVIPLMLMANTNPKFRNLIWWNSPPVAIALIILFLSQFAYAWYMAIIYFG